MIERKSFHSETDEILRFHLGRSSTLDSPLLRSPRSNWFRGQLRSVNSDGSDNQLGGMSRGEPGVRGWVRSEGSQDVAGSLQ